jgi:cytochrome P450
VLGGKWFAPAGTNFWIPLAAVHESSINFSEARQFKPERWLETIAASPANSGRDDTAPGMTVASQEPGSEPTPLGNSANLTKSWLPFSTGPRDCVGQAMAMMNIRCVLIVRKEGTDGLVLPAACARHSPTISQTYSLPSHARLALAVNLVALLDGGTSGHGQ